MKTALKALVCIFVAALFLVPPINTISAETSSGIRSKTAPSILVVWDELGISDIRNATNDSLDDQTGVDYYDINALNTIPTLADLEDYDIVVWVCGYNGAGLYLGGTDSVANYLDRGGRLWLIAPEYFGLFYGERYGLVMNGSVIEDYNVTYANDTNDFAYNYMHVDGGLQDIGAGRNITGLDFESALSFTATNLTLGTTVNHTGYADTILGGYETATILQGNYFIPGENISLAVAYADNATNTYAPKNYKVVFQTIDLGSLLTAANVKTYANNVITWLGARTTASYTTDLGINAINMAVTSDMYSTSRFTTIPLNLAMLGNGGVISGVVGEVSQINVTVKNYGTAAVTNATLKLTVMDSALDLKTVQLAYVTLAAGASTTVSFPWTPGNGNVYSVNAKIYALGDQNALNDFYSGMTRAVTFYDNVESGNGTWTANGSWLVTSTITNDPMARTTVVGNHSLTHAWYCGDGSTIGYNVTSSNLTTAISLANFNATYIPYLTFKVFGVSAVTDNLYVEIKNASAATWFTLYNISGDYNATWYNMGAGTGDETTLGIPLTAYAGNDVEVRFRFAPAAASTTNVGFYVDDIAVFGLEMPAAFTTNVGLDSVDNLGMAIVGYANNFTTTVKNYGASPITNTIVNVTIVNSAGAKEFLTHQTITTISAGATSVRTWSWTPAAAGTYLFIIDVVCQSDGDYSTNTYITKVNAQAKNWILVVDDDAGIGNTGVTQPMELVTSDYSNGSRRAQVGTDVESFVTAALTANSYTYNTYTVPKGFNGPSEELLSEYEIVVWTTGATYTATLTTADQAAVKAYLNDGGKMWIIGQDILFDVTGGVLGTTAPLNTTATASFAKDYLHVATIRHDDMSVYSSITGITAGMMDGVTLTRSAILPTTYGMNESFADFVNATTNATNLFKYFTLDKTGVEYDGAYRLVFFPFEFGEVSSATVRADIAKRVVSTLKHTLALTATADQTVNVTATTGGSAVYTITVAGAGITGNIALTASTPATGWTAVLSAASVAATGGTVTLNVTAPAGATDASTQTVVVTATSTTPAFVTNVPVVTTISNPVVIPPVSAANVIVYSVTLLPTTVEAGNTSVVTVVLKNTGATNATGVVAVVKAGTEILSNSTVAVAGNNGTLNITASYTPATTGTKTITVELNGTASATTGSIVVSAAGAYERYTVAIAASTVSAAPVADDVVAITVIVTNTGTLNLTKTVVIKVGGVAQTTTPSAATTIATGTTAVFYANYTSTAGTKAITVELNGTAVTPTTASTTSVVIAAKPAPAAKGFLPGFEMVFVIAALGAALAIAGRRKD